MLKSKKLGKRSLASFLAFLVLLTCFAVPFSPVAQAAAGDYYYDLYFYVKNGAHLNRLTIDLYYKSNNGTGTETYVRIHDGARTSGWFFDDKSTKSFTGTVNGFPTKVVLSYEIKWGNRGFQITDGNIKVGSSSTASLTTIKSGFWMSENSSSLFSSKSFTTTFTFDDATKYPYVNTATFTGNNPAYVNRNGTNTNVTYSATAVDQYGVTWVNAPTWSISDNSSYAATSIGSSTGTASFGNASDSKDYTATLSANWSSANSGYTNGVTKTHAVTVRVPHKVTVDANGGTYSGTNPVTQKYTGETATFTTPTRTAYDFANWSVKDNSPGSVSGSTYTFGNGDGNVQANWTPHSYTVNFAGNGGTASFASTSYTVEQTALALPVATRTGYTFDKWTVSNVADSNDSNWTLNETVTSAISKKYGDITAKANWIANKYTVNFNLNDSDRTGTASCDTASKTVTYDSAYGILPAPSMTAYNFLGWYTEAQGGELITPESIYKVAGNQTLYAHWGTLPYTVTYDANGGECDATSQYTIEEGSFVTATRTGYTFSLWQVTTSQGNWTSGQTLKADASLAGKYGDVGVKALWTANDYEITYDLNDSDRIGTAVCSATAKTVTYDSPVGELAVPSLTGYDFDGWYTAAQGGEQVTAETVWQTADSVTLYAHWTPVTYVASFNSDGGEPVSSINYNIETTFTFPVDSRIGYTFIVWGEDGSMGNWVSGSTFSASETSPEHMYGNVTFKAQWQANEYIATFDKNDDTSGVGEAVDGEFTQKVVTYDSPVGDMPSPTRTAYEFAGWYTLPDGGELVTAETIYKVADDTTYYAHWTPIEYTVTFNVMDGDEIEPYTYTIEDALTVPGANKTGYDFLYWNVTASSGTWVRNQKYYADGSVQNAWGDVVLQANYEVQYYTITWVINNTIETTTVRYNVFPSHDDPVVTNDPRYEYTFTGWSPKIVRATGDTTYTAIFTQTPKVYTATWLDEGGNTLHTEKIAYGSALPEIAVPEKEGYNGAWDYTGTTMTAGDLTIRPAYTPKKYTVTWVVDGEQIYVDAFDYDSMPVYTYHTPAKAADSKYTYTFSGWSPVISVVKGNTTYTAQYTATPKQYTITFKTDDGEVISSYSLGYGLPVENIPEVPERDNYAGQWVNVPATMPDHDVEITCEYIENARYISWINGESVYKNVALDGTKPVYDRETPQRAETAEYTFTFLGWSDTEDGEILAEFPTVDGAPLSFYAVYSANPKTYTATWIADGSIINTQDVKFGEALPEVAVPEKVGHDGVWNYTGATMPAYNLTLTAVYTPKEYTITWVVNDKPVETVFKYGDTPEFTGSTAKDSTATTDFTFKGWDKPLATVTGDETYTALYDESARVYEVIWRANGVDVEKVPVAYGQAISPIAVPARTGYDGAWEDYPATMPAHDVLILAVYTPKQYTITWVTPQGEVAEQWPYDSTPSYSGTPVKDSTPEMDYTFSGWSPEISKVTGAAKYTAQFAENPRTYTISFVADGIEVFSAPLKYGTTIARPAVPEKEGHSGSWDLAYATMPARDLVVNAVYTPRSYTAYWRVDGVTVFTESIVYGARIPTKNVPHRDGQTGRWDDQFVTMPSRNIVINAIYTNNTYSLTWRIDDQTGEDEVIYMTDYETTFAVTNIPDRLRIVIGGKLVSESAYTYNASTGTLILPGSILIGNVVITERAASGFQNVNLQISNGESSNTAQTVPEGMAYHTDIVAPDGYLIPSKVSVYIDGVLLTKGYTYEAETGRLTINGEEMYGELTISAVCPVDPDYVPPEEQTEPEEEYEGLWGFFRKIINFFRKLFGLPLI